MFNEISVFYITVPNDTQAEKIIRCLLEKKLIACAQIIKAESFYFSSAMIQKDGEYVIIAKTLREYESAASVFVKKIHSYEIPCILSNRWTVNEEYYTWAQKQIAVGL